MRQVEGATDQIRQPLEPRPRGFSTTSSIRASPCPPLGALSGPLLPSRPTTYSDFCSSPRGNTRILSGRSLEAANLATSPELLTHWRALHRMRLPFAV